MKTHPFLSLVLMAGAASAFAASDPKAVDLLDKAAALHGLSSPSSLESVDMETVYSAVSGGVNIPSRWLSRVDFRRHLDLGVRYIYDESDRGIFYQRRIEGSGGKFMYGIASAAQIDLGGYLAGNEIGGVSSIALLAVRAQLEDLKYEGTVNFGDSVFDEVSFTYHKGRGTVFIAKDGRYGGYLDIDLKDNLRIYNIVTAYQSFGSIVVPSRYTIYDDDRKAGGYGKLLSFQANPALSFKDFVMKPSAYDARGSENAFGLQLAPANAPEFEGVKVVAEPRGPSGKAGLAVDDVIVAVDGKDVAKQYFYDVEAQFWEPKVLALTVLKKDGKKVEIKLAR